jgi:hypothetical protein
MSGGYKRDTFEVACHVVRWEGKEVPRRGSVRVAYIQHDDAEAACYVDFHHHCPVSPGSSLAGAATVGTAGSRGTLRPRETPLFPVSITVRNEQRASPCL